MYLAHCKDYRKYPGLMALNHIMLSLSIVVELVVTIVYWSVIHKEVVKRVTDPEELF